MRHSNAVTLVTLALAGLALLGPGCARRVRVQSEQVAVAQPPQYFAPQPTTVLLSQAQPPEVVRGAVIRALSQLGYQTDGEDGTRVLARYGRGRQVVRIQVEYWATQATISYLGSEGLRFRRDGSSPQYDRWMQNLSSSIQGHVAQLARQQVVYPGGGQIIVVQGGAPAAPATQVVVSPAPVVTPAPAATATIQGTVVISP
jgi:hypothetical protein